MGSARGGAPTCLCGMAWPSTGAVLPRWSRICPVHDSRATKPDQCSSRLRTGTMRAAGISGRTSPQRGRQ
jgi:hypothetical protein